MFLLPLVLNKEDPVLYLKCKLRQILDVDLKLPLTNEAKEKALAFAAQQQMSKIEYERRLITGTLESSSVRVAIALLGLTKIEVRMEDRGCAEISLSLRMYRDHNNVFTYKNDESCFSSERQLSSFFPFYLVK